jgi:hypothetical protein
MLHGSVGGRGFFRRCPSHSLLLGGRFLDGSCKRSLDALAAGCAEFGGIGKQLATMGAMHDGHPFLMIWRKRILSGSYYT